MLFKETLGGIKEEIKVNCGNINNIHYADDTSLLANSYN